MKEKHYLRIKLLRGEWCWEGETMTVWNQMADKDKVIEGRMLFGGRNYDNVESNG